MRKIDYNRTADVIEYATNEEISNFKLQEQKDNARLIREIEKVSLMKNCPKVRLWKVYSDIRHAVRGNDKVQGDPQVIRDVLLLQTADTVDVANNVFLQTSLPKISNVLSESLAERSSAMKDNMLVVVVDKNQTVDLGRLREDA
jgi:hypothetical protein